MGGKKKYETDKDAPPKVSLEQKMKDVSQQVADDDQHLNEISKRVDASDQQIAKYDDRNLKNAEAEAALERKLKSLQKPQDSEKE